MAVIEYKVVGEDEVLVSKKEWERLLDVDAFMDALQAAGVDNWDGYDYAKEILAEWTEENE